LCDTFGIADVSFGNQSVGPNGCDLDFVVCLVVPGTVMILLASRCGAPDRRVGHGGFGPANATLGTKVQG